MIEFLFFICVLFLGIVSIYSKKINVLFITIMGLSTFYFLLLCLFHLGIGIEILYVWSNKYLYKLCVYLEQYLFVFINSETFFMRLLKSIMIHGFENSILQIGGLLITITLLLLLTNVFLPYVRGFTFKKLKIRNKIIIKIKKSINTIKEKQSKYILNLVIRC